MSKIGKKPINVPANCQISQQGEELSVSGPLGKVNVRLPNGLGTEKKESAISLMVKVDEERVKTLQGTFRQILANAVKGVTEGWSKELEVKGTGFKASLEGADLVLNLGFSHPVRLTPAEGVKFEVKENKIKVLGADKDKVGLTAAKIRQVCPPDSYKGKGVRYLGEQITLKPGKAAKVGAGFAGGGTK